MRPPTTKDTTESYQSFPETPLPPVGSPEFFNTIVYQNPVYLVSADMPGGGSTTFTQSLLESFKAQHNIDPYTVYLGDEPRKETHEKGYSEIPEPTLYAALPTHRPCIVEGSLATTLGPSYIDPDRPTVCIDLISQPLIAAKRVLEREGSSLADIFLKEPRAILGQLALTKAFIVGEHTTRAQSAKVAELDRQNVFRFTADTTSFSAVELSGRFSGDGDFSRYVPEWEHQALKETLTTLADLRAMLGDKVHRIDVTHFNYHLESIQYNAERLKVILHPEGIAQVRATLREVITDCWFGLTMKEIPRFFATQNGDTTLDTESGAWTPNFYKIAEAWPVLSTVLKDKSVLDPFAGAGTLMNLLVARRIPSSVIMSDLAYKGGVPINDTGNTYLPELNRQAARLVFDSLPSWYRPDFTRLKGYVTADARKLPFADKSVDYIVGDPPYGRRHPSGGLDLLVSVLGECSRVSREGSIFLVPSEWPDQLQKAGYEVELLTNEVSRGLSTHPVCYIRISNRERSG